MYLFIPLILIFASVIGILFIVIRKLPLVKEFAHQTSEGQNLGGLSTENPNNFYTEKSWRAFFYDLCPEVVGWSKKIKIEEYKEGGFIKMEKLLRRLRVAFLKMDHLSGSLIKKIRRRTQNGTSVNAVNQISVVEEKKSPSSPETTAGEVQPLHKATQPSDKLSADTAAGEVKTVVYNISEEEFKKTEQGLIFKIAKNPKGASGYEDLGDFYAKTTNYQDAKESYEAAIKINSEKEELKKKLSQVLEKLV